jgi:hypothetical protein
VSLIHRHLVLRLSSFLALWFPLGRFRDDDDIVYESPLLTLQNTQLLQSAAGLSHAISSAQVPSLRPKAVMNHAKSIAKWGWGAVFGRSDTSGPSGKNRSVSEETEEEDRSTLKQDQDLRAGKLRRTKRERTKGFQDQDGSPTTNILPPILTSDLGAETIMPTTTNTDTTDKSNPTTSTELSTRRGHTALASAFARYHTDAAFKPSMITSSSFGNNHSVAGYKDRQGRESEEEYWWKAWDVRSVLGEVNEMETYGKSKRTS